MLESHILEQLKKGKNLLAFSGGSDSTALFYLLLDHDIAFDIAHVNYNTRAQSRSEAEFATTLAQKHGIVCHLHSLTLDSKNFEHAARSARYAFFETCIQHYGYRALLTAHQLDDRLEWFLMQLSKGAGLHELLGMQAMTPREHYTLIRPLLHVSKKTLQEYLNVRSISWFEDSSNTDARYTRNHFRHCYAAPLMQQFESGIRNTFAFLDEERDTTELHVTRLGKLHRFKASKKRIETVRRVDRELKAMGYVMRQGDRQILKHHDTHVVGRRYSVVITDTHCYIAPYTCDVVMSSDFKETCRRLNIPKEIRAYLFASPDVFEALRSLLLTE